MTAPPDFDPRPADDRLLAEGPAAGRPPYRVSAPSVAAPTTRDFAELPSKAAAGASKGGEARRWTFANRLSVATVRGRPARSGGGHSPGGRRGIACAPASAAPQRGEGGAPWRVRSRIHPLPVAALAVPVFGPVTRRAA
jgi:hypothetical protein